MPVLHIEHQIADLGTWLRDFAGRASARKQAGVTEQHVLQALNDPRRIVELLFFDTADAANSYRTFLRKQVWSSSSPGLAGNPSAIILEELETAADAAAAVLRSTAAAERSARAREEKTKRTRAIERAPWRIEYRSGSIYELWNDSATPKFYVRITGVRCERGPCRGLTPTTQRVSPAATPWMSAPRST